MRGMNLSYGKVLQAAAIALLFATTSALAAVPLTGDKAGPEFRANTFVNSDQSLPSVASDAAGDSIVVWMGLGQDGSGTGIFAQRYDADGQPVGVEFQVNTTSADSQLNPRVAMDAAGDFVVVWYSSHENLSTFEIRTNVFGQLFDKTGVHIGGEFQVNVTPAGQGILAAGVMDALPAVAMDAAGNFVVAWDAKSEDGDGLGVFAQRFDSTGTPLTGADIQVNATTAGDQGTPSVAMSANGAYVIAWTGLDAGNGGTQDAGVFAQLYAADGSVTQPEFRVNTQQVNSQFQASAAMDVAGEFVIAWTSKNQDGSGFGIYAQRYDATGAAAGSEFLVNTTPFGAQFSGTFGDQTDPWVAMDAQGDFAIYWSSDNDGNFSGVFGQAYTADGTVKAGGEANTTIANVQKIPAVAMDAAGDTLVAWEATVQDGSGFGVYAQRFAGFRSVDLSATLDASPLSVVKPGDAITLTASTTNNEAAASPTGIAAIDNALTTATTVQAAITLPAGTSVDSTSGTGWTCPASATADVLTCSFAGGLAAGAVSPDLTVNLLASDTGGVNAFTHDTSGVQPDATAGNNSASAGVTVDHPPVAEDGSLAVVLNTATGGNVTATDLEGDTLTFSKVGDPANGNVVVNADGSFTYTPNNGFTGHDTFTFKANDGNFDSGDGTITLRVDNQAPVASNGTLTTDEDTTGTGSVTATDVEGDGLTFSKVSGPAHGTVTVGADGGYSYTPDADFNGSDSFTFKANDGLADSNTGTVTITVNPVNDAPVATPGTLTLVEDSGANPGTVTGTDVEGDPLTFALVTDAAHGTAVVNPDGSYSYTPAPDFSGSDSFTFKANDGTADSAAGTVTITVTGVNDAPVAADGALTVDEDSTGNPGSAPATDVDGDGLTFSLVGDVSHGSLTFNTNGTYAYTPAANFNGSDSFTFKANDGSVDSNTATVTLTVNAVDDAPVVSDGTLTVVEDSGSNPGTVTGTDVEGDAMTFALAAGAAHGTAVVNPDGSYTYTPDPDFSGSDSFTFKANDGSVDSAAGTVTITVTGVNDAPVTSDGSLSVDQDTSANPGTLTATDADADALTYSLVGGVSHGSLAFNADGTFTYTPDAGFVGSDSFTFKANDGTVDSNVATLSITVSHVNHAPVADLDTQIVNEDSIGNTGSVSATDVDADALTYSLVSDVTHGTLTFNADGSYVYTPDADFGGDTDSFTFKANDGALDSNVATLTIVVLAVNDAPVASAGILTVDEDSIGNPGNASATDVDADALTYSLVSGVAHGTLTFNADGSYSYSPAANFNGSDSFTFKANDGMVDSNTVMVIITVTAVNDAPVAANASLAVNRNTAKIGTLAVTDVDGDALTYVTVRAPAHGKVTLHTDGTYTYKPSAGFTGTDNFKFKANDGAVDSNAAVVSITVTEHAPVGTAQSFSMTHNTTHKGTVTATDKDTGDHHTFSKVALPKHGTLSMTTAGAFAYKPTTGFKGKDSFTFKVSDGAKADLSTTVSITVK